MIMTPQIAMSPCEILNLFVWIARLVFVFYCVVNESRVCPSFPFSGLPFAPPLVACFPIQGDLGRLHELG